MCIIFWITFRFGMAGMDSFASDEGLICTPRGLLLHVIEMGKGAPSSSMAATTATDDEDDDIEETGRSPLFSGTMIADSSIVEG